MFQVFLLFLSHHWLFFFLLPSFSLETSPITDSDTAKRTVFQRSYSVVASEYDKQHSASPARVKAVPRRRVHSGDAGTVVSLCTTQLQMTYYHNDSDWSLWELHQVCCCHIGLGFRQKKKKQFFHLFQSNLNCNWSVLAFPGIQTHKSNVASAMFYCVSYKNAEIAYMRQYNDT